MSIVEIQDPRSRAMAAIAVDRGFNCYQFLADVGGRTVDVIASQPGFEAGSGSPSHSGIPILFPFPNRIRDGRFHWQGRDYQLPLTPGHPHSLHGFCLDRPWRVLSQDEDSVTGCFQLSVDAPDLYEHWPADYILELRYTVRGGTLAAEFTVENPSEELLPWGLGTHAYFRLPLAADSSVADCLMVTPADEEWELVDCLPTGIRRQVDDVTDLRRGEPVTGRRLDHVLTGLTATGEVIETLVMDQRTGLQVAQLFPRDFRELVVFTPPWMDAVCMEPYTCVTDAINLEQAGIDAGWQTLAPGDRFQTQIVIRAGQVLA